MAQELAEELTIDVADFSTDIKSRTNVQSAGIVELLGPVTEVALIAAVAVALLVVRLSLIFQKIAKPEK